MTVWRSRCFSRSSRNSWVSTKSLLPLKRCHPSNCISTHCFHLCILSPQLSTTTITYNNNEHPESDHKLCTILSVSQHDQWPQTMLHIKCILIYNKKKNIYTDDKDVNNQSSLSSFVLVEQLSSNCQVTHDWSASNLWILLAWWPSASAEIYKHIIERYVNIQNKHNSDKMHQWNLILINLKTKHYDTHANHLQGTTHLIHSQQTTPH